MTSTQYRKEYGIRETGDSTRPIFWAAFVLTLILSLVLRYGMAATVSLNGQTCPLSAAYERSDARLVLDGCGTVYLCSASGASYSAAEVLVVPGGCSVDRIFSGEFQ